ncbi:DNA sulfur modification protein DndB [Vibrio breoganii]|uniref:DNA sulfur modification protein DndB n=1 Tax=Vibrio breoganii TaxID=553239 RepID=UPI000C854885|nr:DNA sulfur modification protein DndB [Vibrio breoganii]PML14702.1 DNA sulfur modification protein DndB [Vibrio breoganii]PMM17624.1 DNA sulfur modification protein DndB [Vibrio breoganii]PMO63476.1 DNA sulfur modification protein DndB [Vibrio breoganii]PMP07633.1 DNA sulfur modification protein DndB [Vibrio breoganii]TKF91249.1 DNA sulfur modification protein DndB [Vibrio breoganii]
MQNPQDSGYCYSFPAVRGIQAGRPFFIATCPLRIIPKIFSYNEDDVPPELRAQRTLNKTRIPEMVKYLLDNPKEYVFSALTASVGVDILFDEHDGAPNLGTLRIPMDAQILINDGQHRRKAIEEALRENPDLGQDNLPVLFFIDEGLTRSQQMFADLNKYAVKPSPSLGTLYDHRDESSELARELATSVKPFIGLTEMEKSNISPKSNKLFTLSSIKQSTRALLSKGAKDGFTEEEKKLAAEFWSETTKNIKDWQMVIDKQVSPAQLRQEYIHAHGVGLHAIGVLGKHLLCQEPKDWKEKLKQLSQVNWMKTNPVWIERSMNHGKLSKSTINIQLTANALKIELGLPLTPEEKALEKQLS